MFCANVVTIAKKVKQFAVEKIFRIFAAVNPFKFEPVSSERNMMNTIPQYFPSFIPHYGAEGFFVFGLISRQIPF